MTAHSGLRVAFCLREDATRKPGGDAIQIEATAKALRGLGAHVHVVRGYPSDADAYDVVNLTNLDRPNEMPAIADRLRASRWRGALLLSTIRHPDGWTARIPHSGASSLLP